MKRLLGAAVVWGIFGTVLPTAAADPVRIVTSGYYDVSFDDSGSWELRGEGFVLGGEGLGTVLPFWDCVECPPGTPVSLDAVLLPGDFHWGRADIDGATYENLYYTGQFNFESGSLAAGAGVQGSQPFTFTGNLTAYTTEEHTGAALFSVSLAGSGVATLRFYPELAPDGDAEVLDIRYDFVDGSENAPVPEPATMTLLGAGLAGVIAARRRRS